MSNAVSKTKLLLGAVLLSVSPVLSGSAVAQEMMPRIPPQIILVPRMVVPEARMPIQLQKVDVRAEVLGRAAHTRRPLTASRPST